MSNNVKVQFPQARLDGMISASESFDKRARFDSATENQKYLLQGIMHKDAAESIWFARQLEYIRPGLMEVEYPALEGKSFVPVDSSVGPGASNYTYRSFNKVGTAGLVEDYAKDPPRADVSGQETTQRIAPYGVMYGYSFQELRAGMMAGLPLDTRKAMAARYAMDLKIDQVIWYGDTAGGLMGFANLTGSNAPNTYTLATGVKGTKLWRDKTPDEVVLDLHGIVNKIIGDSFGVYQPDVMVLPLRAYNLISTRRMGDGSNVTILDFFKQTSPYINEVRPSYRLDASQAGNWSGTTGRIICYEKNPDRLSFLLPVEFEQLPPQQVGYEYKTLCHARMGGMITPHPKSMAYADGATDTTD